MICINIKDKKIYNYDLYWDFEMRESFYYVYLDGLHWGYDMSTFNENFIKIKKVCKLEKNELA